MNRTAKLGLTISCCHLATMAALLLVIRASFHLGEQDWRSAVCGLAITASNIMFMPMILLLSEPLPPFLAGATAEVTAAVINSCVVGFSCALIYKRYRHVKEQRKTDNKSIHGTSQ